MKRSDIKKGTIIITGFVAVAYTVIIISLWRQSSPYKGEATPSELIAGPNWTDSISNAASSLPSLRGMEAEMARFMGRWNIKGISLAVTRHDSLLFARGFGWADMEAGRKLEAADVMRIASASKLVTAAAIMKLVEQGKISLSSRVFGAGGLLPDTAFSNAVRDSRHFEITVDNLLRHQGGFTLGAGDPMFNTKDIMAARHLSSPPSPAELIRIVIGRRLGFSPGAGRKYSNFGYFLLSMIIEKQSGMSYWDFVQKEVLHPAGAFGFIPASNSYEARGEHESRYYAPDDELVEEFNGSGRMVPRIYGGSNVNGLMGAGGWCASAASLARLVAAIDLDPTVPDVLSSHYIDLMTEHSDTEKMSRGWSEADAQGKWVRTGTLSSTHTLVERFPDGECWVMITNTGVWTGHHFSGDMSRLIERLRQNYSASLPRRNLW